MQENIMVLGYEEPEEDDYDEYMEYLNEKDDRRYENEIFERLKEEK